MFILSVLLFLAIHLHNANAYAFHTSVANIALNPTESYRTKHYSRHPIQYSRTCLRMDRQSDTKKNFDEGDRVVQGYTIKQRLREEIESPFRKVRLVFFGASAASALIALYFSAIRALSYSTSATSLSDTSNSIMMQESLTNCAINFSAVVVCSLLAYRDYRIGEANLERIAHGGALARLRVSVVSSSIALDSTTSDAIASTVPIPTMKTVTLGEYRKSSRVLICAGGKDYIQNVCRSLNADQLQDENNIVDKLLDVDVVVVPVLLEEATTLRNTNKNGMIYQVGETNTCWFNTNPKDEVDRNFNSHRSDPVIAFPKGQTSWSDYLASEVNTAQSQGYDVLVKGITITVKKNGRILRRATGMPRWRDLISTMEVMDGTFGMPGDSPQ